MHQYAYIKQFNEYRLQKPVVVLDMTDIYMTLLDDKRRLYDDADYIYSNDKSYLNKYLNRFHHKAEIEQKVDGDWIPLSQVKSNKTKPKDVVKYSIVEYKDSNPYYSRDVYTDLDKTTADTKLAELNRKLSDDSDYSYSLESYKVLSKR